MDNRFVNLIKTYVNKDTFATLANNVLSLIKGPIIMLLIAAYLSENAQGYWYAFGSLAALSTLADLGFGTLVGQFSAHEFAKLRFDSQMRFEGEEQQIEKMSSLFKYVIKWAVSVTCIAYPLIMVIGFIVLNTHGGIEIWGIPWTIYILNSGISFIVSIILAFFEGCALINKIQFNKLVSVVVISITSIVFLVVKWELYAMVIPYVLGNLANIILLLIVFYRPIAQLSKIKPKQKYNWKHNFLSLIWKYALSWASGYLIFQIYTPLAYLVYDPALAGKVGITMTLCQACYTIANTFNYVFVPRINISISERKFTRAQSFMKKGLVVSMGLFVVGASIILFVVGFLVKYISLFERFLGPIAAAWLLLAWFIQLPVNVIATYARAYKQEPYMVYSIISAVISATITLITVFTLPIDYLFMGFAITNVLFVYLFYRKYKKNKEKWAADFICRQDKELEAEVINEETLIALKQNEEDSDNNIKDNNTEKNNENN